MYCRKCKTLISKNGKYCPTCGTPVQEDKKSSLIVKMYSVLYYAIFTVLYIPIAELIVAVVGIFIKPKPIITLFLTVAASIIAHIYTSRIFNKIKQRRLKKMQEKIDTLEAQLLASAHARYESAAQQVLSESDDTPEEDDYYTEVCKALETQRRGDAISESGYSRNKKVFSAILDAIPKADIPLQYNVSPLKHRSLSDMQNFYFSHVLHVSPDINPQELSDFIVVDTETTGLEPEKHKIVELSAIHYVRNQPVEVWTSLINPRRHIPAKASEINKITDDMVADAPAIEEAKTSFETFLSKSNILVGHNLGFDMKFLWTNNIDVPTNMILMDTLLLSREAFTLPNYKLGTVADHLGISYDAHRSAADCYATGQVFISCVKEICNQELEKRNMND